METSATPQNPDAPSGQPPAAWPLFLLGVLLFAVGPLLYYVQFQMAVLSTPWYVPLLASVGLVFMVMSLARRKGWLRTIAAVLFFVFLCFEWFMLVVAVKNPIYQGPAQTAQQVPAFTTTLASGEAFTNLDLAQGTRSLLVFFRGRW